MLHKLNTINSLDKGPESEIIKIITNNVLRIVGGSILWKRDMIGGDDGFPGDVITLRWEKRFTGREQLDYNYLEYRLAVMQIEEVRDPSVISNMILEAIFNKYPEERAWQNSRNVTISPSRRYVAVCVSMKGGYYFRSFTLPMDHEINNSEEAGWYFLNRLDHTAFIQGCFTWEDFSNLKEIGSEFIS